MNAAHSDASLAHRVSIAMPPMLTLRLRLVAAVMPLVLCAPVSATADALLVVRKSADAVDIIEPGSGVRLMSVPVGHVPHEVAVSPDGKRAVVTNYGTAERPGHTVSVLDLEQPRVIGEIDLGKHTRPHGVAWYAPDRAAVTTEGSGQLLIVDPGARRIVDEIATGQSASHMVVVTPDRTLAFVANIDSGSTTVIALAKGKKVRDLDTGAGSEGIALTPDGQFAWVVARGGRIAIADTRTLEIVHRIELPGVPIRIAFTPDGRIALVSCAGNGEVVAIDVGSRAVTTRRRLDLPPAARATSRSAAGSGAGDSSVPVGLAIDDSKVYVAATMADAVVELSLPSLEVQRTIAVDGEPDGLGRTPLLPKFECHACEKPGQ
jgi:DNA-binding beta-propeller fold protein YncE